METYKKSNFLSTNFCLNNLLAVNLRLRKGTNEIYTRIKKKKKSIVMTFILKITNRNFKQEETFPEKMKQ